MKIIRLVRLEQSKDGALGSLLIDGKLFCSTLEPDANDPERFQIPAGEYICKRFHGTKWTDTFEIPVEGHTALLFHSGNVEGDTVGCILLARQPSYLGKYRAVLNSGFTFREFLRIMKNEQEFQLIIQDYYK